jgi:RNA polymerase sigma factor (sigma-70 family)
VNKLGPAQIIIGIKQRDHKILTRIYKDFYPLVAGYIRKQGGSETDAKDIFQEALIVIYKLLEENEKEIINDFGSYLMGISKRIWFKQIRQSEIHERYVNQSDKSFFEDHPSDVELENELELALIRKHILKLGEECQKVLLWSAEGMSSQEIAEKLNYKSDKIVNSKKYKCKEALIEMIKNDPDFKNKDL